MKSFKVWNKELFEFIKKQCRLQPFWELIESYRKFYSYFYSVKVDFSSSGFLILNKKKSQLKSYILEIIFVLLYGCFGSSYIALVEYSKRKSESWHFKEMNLINLVIIIMIGWSGFAQLALFQASTKSAPEVVYGYNSLKSFLYRIGQSK